MPSWGYHSAIPSAHTNSFEVIQLLVLMSIEHT
jgi:hypothetical protein